MYLMFNTNVCVIGLCFKEWSHLTQMYLNCVLSSSVDKTVLQLTHFERHSWTYVVIRVPQKKKYLVSTDLGLLYQQ